MKNYKDMDKEHVHMDQHLEVEVGMVDEDWEGNSMGLDTGMEKVIHDYPSDTQQKILTPKKLRF